MSCACSQIHLRNEQYSPIAAAQGQDISQRKTATLLPAPFEAWACASEGASGTWLIEAWWVQQSPPLAISLSEAEHLMFVLSALESAASLLASGRSDGRTGQDSRGMK